MPNRIGLYFASHHGQTRAITAAIGQRLANRGCDVTISDLEGDPRTRPGVHEFDTVLIGAPLYIRRYPSAVTRFIRAHLTDLRRHPSTGFFSVCLTAALGTPEAYIESLGPLRELLSDIDWTPDWIASFGGALKFRQYDPLTRWVLRRIAAHYHYPTDTKRDYDLTSWETVERFADHVFQNAADSPFSSSALSLPNRTLDRLMPTFDERITASITGCRAGTRRHTR
jgi:menaquinone-dependent protoporphyrinogen oxidase